jgi:hypothetical protein
MHDEALNWLVFEVKIFRKDGSVGKHTVAAPDDVHARKAAILLDDRVEIEAQEEGEEARWDEIPGGLQAAPIQEDQECELAPVWYCTVEMLAEVENSEMFAE